MGSGVNTRLLKVWPGSSPAWSYMWVEFASRGFLRVLRFPPSKEKTRIEELHENQLRSLDACGFLS